MKTLFSIGFRPLFLFASVLAIASMIQWLLSTRGYLPPVIHGQPMMAWHSHSLIYGYGLAIVGGFLLTAAGNWTGIRTLHGRPLMLLVSLWVAARLLILLPIPVSVTAALDCAFAAGLTVAVAIPILRAHSANNYSIVAKLVLLLVSNVVFYGGVLGAVDDGVRLGLYSGLYLLLALIFTIGRRVLPFFIERASPQNSKVKNWRSLDIASLVAFLFFWISELVQPYGLWSAMLAGLLFLIHSARLIIWYTPIIWQHALLWILYLSYMGVILGFALTVLAYITGLNPYLATHAFAVAGIGGMTLGMMARIILGHTGRDIYNPPRAIAAMFAALLAAGVLRVAFPIALPDSYGLWLLLSQGLWIMAFLMFARVYWPMLVSPRVDGREV